MKGTGTWSWDGGLTASSGKRLCTTYMKQYSKGRETIFDPARKSAAKAGEGIIRTDTNRGPASLQNRSIRLIVALVSSH
jgi:hypothetical protein